MNSLQLVQVCLQRSRVRLRLHLLRPQTNRRLSQLLVGSYQSGVTCFQQCGDGLRTWGRCFQLSVNLLQMSKNCIQTRKNREVSSLEMVNGALETVDVGLERVDGRVETVDAGLEWVCAQVETVDAGLEQVDARVETVNARLEMVDIGVDRVEAGMVRAERRGVLELVPAVTQATCRAEPRRRVAVATALCVTSPAGHGWNKFQHSTARCALLSINNN